MPLIAICPVCRTQMTHKDDREVTILKCPKCESGVSPSKIPPSRTSPAPPEILSPLPPSESKVDKSSIKFLCPVCRSVMRIAGQKAGTTIRCPKCDQCVIVPIPRDRPIEGILLESELPSLLPPLPPEPSTPKKQPSGPKVVENNVELPPLPPEPTTPKKQPFGPKAIEYNAELPPPLAPEPSTPKKQPFGPKVVEYNAELPPSVPPVPLYTSGPPPEPKVVEYNSDLFPEPMKSPEQKTELEVVEYDTDTNERFDNYMLKRSQKKYWQKKLVRSRKRLAFWILLDVFLLVAIILLGPAVWWRITQLFH
jgi:uncharacterized CHY-type Zn-finger protein